MEDEPKTTVENTPMSSKDAILGLMSLIQRQMDLSRKTGDPLISPQEIKFIAASAYGLDPTEAAGVAGYEEPEISGRILMKQRNIQDGLQLSLNTRGLTIDYLCDKVKDLCEASDEKKGGKMAPNWRARSSGIEHLSRLHGLHKTTTIKAELTFEERLARLDVGIETEE